MKAKQVDWSKFDLSNIPGYTSGKPTTREDLEGVDYWDEIEAAWGRKWNGTGLGKLHMAAVHRPGTEEVHELQRRDPAFFGKAIGDDGRPILPDLKKLQEQHDAYVKVLKDNGVEVVYGNFPDPAIGTYTPLNVLCAPDPTILRGGAMIPRLALACKRGNEVLWAKRLIEVGCPIIGMVAGKGIYDGRPVFLDQKHALIGFGLRANAEGVRQVEAMLRLTGVEEIHIVPLPGYLQRRTRPYGAEAGSFHLDNILGMADRKLAVVYTGGVPFNTLVYLQKLGIELIEIPEDEVSKGPGNLFVLEPGKVLIPSGAPKTVAALRSAGVSCIEVELSEFTTTTGIGPTCLTLPMVRDEAPGLAD